MTSVLHWIKRRAQKVSANRKPAKIEQKGPVSDELLKQNKDAEVTGDLERTIQFVNMILGQNDDFVAHRFRIFGQFDAVVFYIANYADVEHTNMHILRPLMREPTTVEQKALAGGERLQDILSFDALYTCEGKGENHFDAIIGEILQGRTVLAAEGMEVAITLSSRKVEKRSIDQPETEQVIRGPREGFIEMLGTNIALLRYRLQTPDFRVKVMRIGRLTNSAVAICYLDGIVNTQLVEEVEYRLSYIEIDGVLDSGYLEQYIEDNNWSPFPQVQNTERPDKAVANLLEGRVVIIVDGSPFALIVPTVFAQFYQTAEDYSGRFLLVSFIRMARLIALIFSLIFPSLYVALLSFNPELIPTEFAVAVSGGRAGVPFPSVIEVLAMETSMEVLREATLRLPQQVGGALSIVGVLVVGQAAVSAGFVSPITVVVIALTTIGSFATPAYNAALALRLLRFPLIILSGIFGLYGVMVGLILIANHMLSLRSFGVPYLSPVVPGNFKGMMDTLVRMPLWMMRRRPAQLHPKNDIRVSENTKKAVKAGPHNTLDPLKVGNVRRDVPDGVSSPDHDDSSGDHSH